MAYVSYTDYTVLGYRDIPEAEFPRWVAKAEGFVRLRTFNRITAENITGPNKRGVCEIADVFFACSRPAVGGCGVPLASFSNEGYSETYLTGAAAGDLQSQRLRMCVDMYFTPEQLYRGV